ncbi:C39 family peptidase [Cytobacillus spongiae]|jgi:uncharacterized protein YvpB|uniref:C39 family peptidase n=1 Tax=Cytobacillus spongiae TaxID=2901381 RepID=UPI001F1D67D8|nr:C39 family peptidase [Cytobacillus spongiae]UII57222.1 C39 family peptidase [Cytobacillus spongiae]
MRKTHLLLVLLPLLGCNHTESTPKQNETTSITEDSTRQHRLPTNNELAQQISGIHTKEKMRPTQTDARKQKILLDVPLIKQNPELKYGCEVTSLAMVLQYAKVKTDKMTLYRQVKKDPDPLVKTKGDIVRWGNPTEGFVGDMTGRRAGYAVFDQPIEKLINDYLPGKAVNFTNKRFDDLLSHVSDGYPIVVWTTGDYRLPDRWEAWLHGKQTIKTPLDLHAVVLVGYDTTHVYINDPLSGKKQVRVNKKQFIASWKALNSRAVSFRD